MMDKIVYLFGAGASQEALPISKEIPRRISWIHSFIEGIISDPALSELGMGFSADISPKTLLGELKWLQEESSKHFSVDTFAKKLFITNDLQKLKKLKLALSVFFVCEQIANPLDKRYDAFFATLITDGLALPEQIKIITWNYDHQFELSFSGFINQERKSGSLDSLNCIMKEGKYPAIADNFTLFKLNGDASLSPAGNISQEHSFTHKTTEHLNAESFTPIYKAWAKATESNFEPNLSFAWEKAKGHNIVEVIKKRISSATSLVIIGYSFPYFNRKIDREIILSMNKLKMVYFQSPDADTIMDRFDTIVNLSKLDVKKPITDIAQFYIPNELL